MKAAGDNRGILVPVSLDTKAEEARFLRDELSRLGVQHFIVDTGIQGVPGISADVSREEIAALAGTSIEELNKRQHRSYAIAAMLRGLAALVEQKISDGSLTGCLGVGGGTGAAFAAEVFRRMPFGQPKVLVSTVASGDTTPFVGGKDVILFHSVVDVMDLNPLIKDVLRRSARIVAALDKDQSTAKGRQSDKPVIGLTSFGATTPAANAAIEILRGGGTEVLPFHARGIGGRAMEDLIREKKIQAVLDLTTTEITDEICGGLRTAGPDRLDAACEAGIPQVILPGAIDMINFGASETIPAEKRARNIIEHTPHVSLVRSSVEENVRIAEFVASKLNKARGEVEIIVPLKGFSAYDRQGQPFFDPEADTAFLDTLRKRYQRPSHIHEIDAHINDPDVAGLSAKTLLALMNQECGSL